MNEATTTERPLALGGDDIRAILSGKTQLRWPIPVDDSPITEAQASAGERQRGIPTNAQNLRFCGDYLKCDSPDGSYTASSRVTVPCEPDDVVWVQETWRPDYSHDPEDTRYRADLPDDVDPVIVDLYPWEASADMAHSRSRLSLRIVRVAFERAGDGYVWVVDFEVVR